MTTYSLPSRLPLGTPLLLGLPYHGLVTNEELTLPSGRKLEITFAGHQTVLVEARTPPTPDYTAKQTAYHTAQGWQWKDYALLSGYYRDIGGQQLGPQSWIYSDETRSWIVDLEIEKDGLTLIVRLYLRQLFGHFDMAGTPPAMAARRKLDEITITPVSYTGTTQRPAEAALARYLFLTHSSHGTLTAINLACSLDEGGSSFFGTGFGYQYGGNGYVVHDVLQATISGNGSIVSGSVGSGISGSLTHVKNAQEMYNFASSTTGSPAPVFTDAPSYEEIGYSESALGCESYITTWDAINEFQAIWRDGSSDDSGGGVYTTSTARALYAAVTAAGDFVWLETETETATTWAYEYSHGGELTVTTTVTQQGLPYCTKTYAFAYSGLMTWTVEQTSSAVTSYTTRFGATEFTATRTVGTLARKAWRCVDGVSLTLTINLEENIAANNEDTPEYLTTCAYGGAVSGSCSGVFSGSWSCPATAGAILPQMVEPQVFKVGAGGGCSGTSSTVYQLVSVNGHTDTGYSDPPGTSAKLVSYHPKTGAFAIAATSADLVSWV